jgi:hypothetical protein
MDLARIHAMLRKIKRNNTGHFLIEGFFIINTAAGARIN